MYGQGKPVLASHFVGTGRVATFADRERPQEMAREPAGQVEEVEVLDLGCQTPYLARKRDQEVVPERRLAVDQRVERVPSQDLGLGRLERDGGRRARGTVEQRQLSEEPAGPDGREDGGLGAVVGRDRGLDRALRHQEQRVSGISSMEDRLALAEATRAKGRGAQPERDLVEVGEQPAGTERLPRGIWRGGGPDHGLHRTRREPLAAV